MKTIKFWPVQRDRLFFDRFAYSICYIMEEAGCLRAHNTTELLKTVSWRNANRERWRASQPQIEQHTVSDLLHMWELLNSRGDQCKYTVSYNRVYVYSNDAVWLQGLAQQTYTQVSYAQQAQVTRPRDTVIKQNPQFALRSYFRDRHLEAYEQQRLRTFLESRPESFGITASFRQNLNRPKWFFLARHQYIEHNHVSDLTMLSLVIPGIIRKTVPVVAK
jgi:hypothetical protein